MQIILLHTNIIYTFIHLSNSQITFYEKDSLILDFKVCCIQHEHWTKHNLGNNFIFEIFTDNLFKWMWLWLPMRNLNKKIFCWCVSFSSMKITSLYYIIMRPSSMVKFIQLCRYFDGNDFRELLIQQ